jgi:hypothetical protein
MSLTNLHLMMLRALTTRGWEVALKQYLLSRHDATEADLDALVAAKLVWVRKGRLELTDEGRKQYRKQKVGRYF